jgi:hypothetical protein
MDFEKIPSLLETFSKQHDYEYDNNPLPFIPFGGISGIHKGCKIFYYIRRTESRAAHFYHSVFGLSDGNVFPEGFCLEYYGNPYKEGLEFKEIVKILSFDTSIVTDFVDRKKEALLMSSFEEIDIIDESLFKERSELRLSENGMILTAGKIFEETDTLNFAFFKVLKVFVELQNRLSSNI